MKAFASIARLTLIEAWRTRVWLLALVALVVLLLLAEFAAGLAITDSASYRSGIYAALARLVCVLVTMLFVAQSLARELADRLLDLTLARAVSRAQWFLARLSGFAAGGVMLAALASAPLLWLAPAPAVFAWGVSLALELAVVAAVCQTCSVTLRQVTLAVSVTSAFYLLARAIDAMVLMSQAAVTDPTQWTSRVIGEAVRLIALVLPALDRFTAAAWLQSGAEAPELLPVALDSAVFIALVIAIGLFDFYRSEA